MSRPRGWSQALGAEAECSQDISERLFPLRLSLLRQPQSGQRFGETPGLLV